MLAVGALAAIYASCRDSQQWLNSLNRRAGCA
jgi:hypothetical protein